MTKIDISRRAFALGLGTAAAGLTIGFRLAEAQTPAAAPPAGPPTPPMLAANPQLDSWVRITPDGKITVLTGRVEIGQGTLTAMRQAAADELDVAPEAMTLISGDTASSPNEGVTAGSLSIKLGSTALAVACADARMTLIKVAAGAWGVAPETLKVENAVILGADGKRMSYGEAASKVSLSRPVDLTAKRKPAAQGKHIGTSMPRTDIPAKVYGQQVFIHDLRPDGMLFGSVARPPAYAAKLKSADLAAIKAMPGVVEVVRDGSFLGVVAKREEQARAAAVKLAASAEWDKGPGLFAGKGIFDYLQSAAAETKLIHTTKGDAPTAAVTHTAEYRRAFQAHASIGASCALAQWQDGKLTVWSHTQGPYPLRGELAKALKIAAPQIRVIHAQGSGCYGHNGADDVALDAALLSRAVGGKPVRVHWAHEEEMAWEPWGSAMVVKLAGGVAADGALVDWKHDVWSFPHSTRPGSPGEGCNLRSAWYLENPVAAPKPVDVPLPNGAAGRNAVPVYASPNQAITTHLLTEMPIRTSALRTLGGFFNALAAEMFVDDLAAKAGKDPLAFRDSNIKDPRLRAVLRKAGEMANWKPQVVAAKPIAGEMQGMGIGVSKYKNLDSYVAVVAEVTVDTRSGRVRVDRMWSATDTGRIVSPDGALNQIEGGMIQATSWTLLESGRWNDGIMTSVDYVGYPIIDFERTPVIQSALIDKPDLPSLGVGEGSQAPAGAAIANAIFAATGRRVNEVPFTPERVLAALKA